MKTPIPENRVKGEPRELPVGAVIEGYWSDNMGIRRRLTEVRDTGYSWVYPEIPEKEFYSEDSNDQFFFWNWKRIE